MSRMIGGMSALASALPGFMSDEPPGISALLDMSLRDMSEVEDISERVLLALFVTLFVTLFVVVLFVLLESSEQAETMHSVQIKSVVSRLFIRVEPP